MNKFLTTDPPNDVISVAQNFRIPGFHLENECRTGDSLHILTPQLSSLDSNEILQISLPENSLRHPEVIRTSAQTEILKQKHCQHLNFILITTHLFCAVLVLLFLRGSCLTWRVP